MKRNDILIIISLVFYSILFYKQSAGINYAIFSVILTALLFLRDNSVAKNTQWVAAAIGSITTGITVAIIGSPLTVIANITALSLLSAFSISRKSSVIFGLIYAMMSYVTSIVFVIIDAVDKKPRQKEKTEKSSNFWTKFLVYLAIAIVIIIFFLLYRGSNALFKEFTKNINLDFISWQWIGFMFIGFLLFYGFFIHKNFPGLYKKEEATSDNLDESKISQKQSRIFGKSFTIYSEYFSGIVLFALLNFLILIVNILDISYLWTGAKLPEGLTYADLVHQGVGNLIFSIIIAILIILFYFRSKLNFYEKKRALQILAYIWILQNIFMIVSTVLRNQLYIEQYSLTYKRIGVYVYLLLAAIGLITTFVKIMNAKSNWFLYRKNGWAFFAVMVFACFINWDMLITNYNLKHSKTLDKYYLLDLSWSNTPDLLQLPIDQIEIENEYPDYTNYIFRTFGITERSSFHDDKNFTARLHFKLYRFLEHKSGLDWQSWTHVKSKISKEIKQLDEDGKLDSLYLKSNSIEEIKPLGALKNIKYLDINDNKISDIEKWGEQKKMNYLDISDNHIDSLTRLPEMPKLKVLKAANTGIGNLGVLNRYKNLEILDISGNSTLLFQTLPKHLKLKELDISRNNINNYVPLKKLSKLEILHASNMTNRDISTMPLISDLKSIDLSDNKISNFDIPLFKKLTNFPNLEALNLAENSFSNLYMLTNRIFTDRNYINKSTNNLKPVFANLKKLDISGNTVYDTYPLTIYEGLQELNIEGNKIEGTDNIARLQNLTYLNAANNKLRDVDGFENLNKLKHLSIASNELRTIGPIKKLELIEYLDAHRNDLTDFSEFENFKNLKFLDIAYNSISSIEGIDRMKALKVLKISYNSIADYSILYNMDWLEILEVHGISDDEFQKLEEKLPNTTVIKYANRY